MFYVILNIVYLFKFRLLIIFAYSLDPYQAQQKAGPDLVQHSNDIPEKFLKQLIIKKIADNIETCKITQYANSSESK